ncbi:MAG: LPS export ABC transporter permease LptF [Xanthomonadales bacterium]|nr:LPS export ABC transporter permease LptF [Xanthomonadales bacterium]
MSILQKYILREWFWTSLAVSIVLVIVLVGAYLGDMLNDIADGRMPAGLLGTQLLLHMPQTLENILPLAGFVAVMWGLGRFYRDQEMAVMRSSGFGWRQLFRPLLSLVGPMAALLLVLGLWAAPMAARVAEEQLEQALRSAAVWGLQAGKFHVLRHGQLVIYAEAIEEEGTSLRNIFIKQRENGREQVWVAQKGSYWMDAETGDRYLILEQGKVTELAPGQLDLRVLSFVRNDLRLPEPEFRKRKNTGLDSKSSSDLLSEGNAEAVAELQWRLSPAITVLVLGLLAIPLAHSEPREGRGVRIVLGSLVYLLYGNLVYLCRSWVADGFLPTYIGIWWVHAFFLVFSFVWVQRQGRFPVKLAVK